MSDIKANFIGGQWVASDDASIDRNPSDLADVIGEYALADSQQVADAIASAKEAAVTWGYSSIQDRFDLLDRVGSALIERAEEFGSILSREEGKVLRDGIGEAIRAGRVFKYFAGEALRLGGEKLPSVRPGVEVEVSREPLGIVGVITPWNFPLAIPAWKIAPALAFGNTVIFKPASNVPASAWELTRLIIESGAPPGAFNLLMGQGSIVGEAIVSNPDVAGISFTGSVAIGRNLASAAITRMAKVQLEMGGKNPLVILDDADLSIALDCAIQGGFEQTGQRCTASSRVIVTENIYDRFISGLSERLGNITVGHALDPKTDIGPVVDAKQLDLDLHYLEVGTAEGAHLAFGGQRLERETEGYFLEPGVFLDATNDMAIAQEEIFGPIVSIIRVKSYDEAVDLANDTEFGLVAGIVTSSLKHASHFRRASQSGMVMVNLPTAGVDYHVPFGGRKTSSYGPREQGSYAAEFFTSVKTTYVRP